MPQRADHLLLAASVGLAIFLWLVIYPRAQRAVAAGEKSARLQLYVYILFITWTLTIALAFVWMRSGRSFADLGLRVGTAKRLVGGLAAAALYVVFALRQRSALIGQQHLLIKVSESFTDVTTLMPTSANERWTFRAMSITAGICEEIFFRGFVFWYLASYAGTIAAVLGSALLFGFDHRYLGAKYVLRTAIGGVAFALLVVLSGSLWAAIIVHTTADLVSGDLGWHALRALERAPKNARKQTRADDGYEAPNESGTTTPGAGERTSTPLR